VQTTGLRLAIAAVLAASFPVPASARVAVDPVIVTSQATRSRVVWVALEEAHKIAKVNLRSRAVIKRRSVPGAPHNLTISPSGRTIAAALWSAGSIVVRRNGKQRTVALGGAPHDVKINGGRIVVANQTEARLDLVTPRGRFRRSIELKADPHDVALRWGGRQAWVTLEGSDDLAVVRIRRPSRVRYVSTGKAPHDLLFAPDESFGCRTGMAQSTSSPSVGEG
jgi:DNA-binding beta-propeller fold protein YncE